MARNKSVVISLSNVKNTVAGGCAAGRDGGSCGRTDRLRIFRWHARVQAVLVGRSVDAQRRCQPV